MKFDNSIFFYIPVLPTPDRPKTVILAEIRFLSLAHILSCLFAFDTIFASQDVFERRRKNSVTRHLSFSMDLFALPS